MGNRYTDSYEQAKLLEQIRQTYGNKNQIMVCMEELNELACVLAKYPRYEDEDRARVELFDKVLDEVADVTIILDHVVNIFDISPEAVSERMQQKTDRIRRWLSKSTSMQQTIDDRAVEKHSCTSCHRSEDDGLCPSCRAAEGEEGVKPFYKRG